MASTHGFSRECPPPGKITCCEWGSAAAIGPRSPTGVAASIVPSTRSAGTSARRSSCSHGGAGLFGQYLQASRIGPMRDMPRKVLAVARRTSSSVTPASDSAQVIERYAPTLRSWVRVIPA